jgi:hypothetical protein
MSEPQCRSWDGRASSGLPAPIELETFAMPTDDCFWFYDHEARAPVGPKLGQPNPKEPVTLTEFGTLHRHLENGKLLSEGEVFSNQGYTRKEKHAEDVEEQPYHVHSSPPFGIRQGELYRENQVEAKRVSFCDARRTDFSGGTGLLGGKSRQAVQNAARACTNNGGDGNRSDAVKPNGIPELATSGMGVQKSGRRDSNPRRPAWEAGILPLNYARKRLPINALRTTSRIA